VTGLQGDLDKINETYAPLLKDPWLRYAVTHFGAAQQAVKSLVVEGKANVASVGQFHSALDDFLRALDQLPKWEPGTTGWDGVKGTKKPKESLVKQARNAIAAIKAKANHIPDLRETALIEFTDVTTAEQAVEYYAATMDRIDGLLYDRELSQITGGGRSKTIEVVGKSLQALKDSLAAIGDAPAQADAKGPNGFSERIGAAKACVVAFRKDATILGNALPWAKPRIELFLPDLDWIEKNLAKLRPPKK
jgi:hypothetical protein